MELSCKRSCVWYASLHLALAMLDFILFSTDGLRRNIFVFSDEPSLKCCDFGLVFVVLNDEAMTGAEAHDLTPSFFSRRTISRRHIGKLCVVIGRRRPERMLMSVLL